MTFDAGAAHLRIFPTLDGVASKIDREARKWGISAGKIFGQAFSEEAKKGTDNTPLGPGKTSAAKDGAESGGAFAEGFRKRIEASLRALPDIEIGAATNEAEQKIRDLTAQLQALSRKRIGVDIEATEALAEIDRLGAELDELGRTSPDIQVRVDAAAAAGQLLKLREEVASLDGRDVDIQVDVDSGGAMAQLLDINTAAANAGNGISALALIGAGLAPAIVPAAAAAAAAIGALAPIAAGVGAGIGVAVLGFSGIADAVGEINKANEAAATSTAKVSTGQDQVKAATERVADAEDNLRNVRIANAQAAKRAIEDVEAAERGVADARREAADAIAAAGDRVTAAETDLAAAQRESAAVTRDLTSARQAYREQMEDLDSSVKGNAIAQRQANLDIVEAKAALDKVLADPRATLAQREQAEITYERQKLSFDDLRTRGKRLAAEQAAQAKKGVDGSDQVAAARKQIADADQRVADAQKGVGVAQAAQTKARVDGARKISDAQRRLASAQEAQTETARRGALAVVAAQRQIVRSQAQVEAASARAFAAMATGAEDVGTKLRRMGLGPTQIAFARFITGLKGQFNSVRETAARGFLPNIQAGLGNLLDTQGARIERFVGNVSGAIGRVVDKAFGALGGPAFQRFFAMLERTAGPNVEKFGKILGNLAIGFANIVTAFEPMSNDLGDGIVGLTDKFAKWSAGLADSPGFRAFIDYVKANAPVLLALFGNVVRLVKNLVIGLSPLGSDILSTLTKVTGAIADLDPSTLANIAKGVFLVVGAFKALSVLANVVSSIAGIVSAGKILVTFIRGPLITGIRAFGTALFTTPIGWLVLGITALVVALVYLYRNNDKARAFIQAAWARIRQAVATAWVAVRGALRSFVDFIRTKVVPAVQRFWVGVVRPAFRGIAEIVRWAWANVIRPTFNAIVYVLKTFVFPIIRGFYRNVVKPVFTLIKIAIQVAWAAIKIVFGLWLIYFKQVLYPGLRFLYDHVVKPLFRKLSDLIKAVWQRGIRPVFSALANYVKDHVAPAFKAGVDAIDKAWRRVRDVAKVPVRFIVETVLNNGIIAGYNKLAETFGAPHVDPIKLPKGFASGGVLPGYTPGRDVHRFVSSTGGALDLSGGEAIMRPEFTRAVGPGWVNTVNRAARQGGTAAVLRNLGGYKDGGILGSIGDVWNKAKRKATDVIAGVGSFLGDPAGAIKTLIDRLVRLIPGAGSGIAAMAAGVPRKLQSFAASFVKGLIGRNQEGDGGNGTPSPGGLGGSAGMIAILRQAFPGLRLISGDRPGAITATGNVSYHSRNRAVDVPPRRDVFDWIRKHYPNTAELIFSPAGLAQLWNGQPHMYTGITRAMHFNHVHWAYDNGGYLPPGYSTVYNGTGRPEPVLTSGQWSAIRSLSKAQTAGGSMEIRVRVEDGKVVGLVDAHVDKRMGVLADALVYNTA